MLFFIIVTVLVASANAKYYTDCGSKLATVQKVEVSGCDAKNAECVLRRNTNATFSIDFTPYKETKEVVTIVHGVIMNLPVPFPLPQPDACKDSGLTCPLREEQSSSYHTTMPILKSYPRVKVDVKWELKDENDEDLVCILIAAKIQ
ncbi:ecdysteroid-regulated 16 kDa protein [Helicoverpa zea]|uniref:ecdysteroid-regulated 16 kDa protein n=1 Tax=Helicoverpa zea TaxID=7113 RepID=UPI001F577572|nr:ecdysteroid-regulated 16 kDa protein [Helicoverpa zea]